MALFTDILTPSVKPVAASPATLRTDKSIWPTPLKQVCLTGIFCLEPLPKLLKAHPFLLAHNSPTFPCCGYAITSIVPLSGTISCALLTYRDNHKKNCGYPFYSARYALQSAGFSRHKHINEPLRNQKCILMARRTHLGLGQTLAAQRLEVS